MEDRGGSAASPVGFARFRGELILLVLSAIVFFGCIVSPPSLMDDVDAVQAQIARNMLDSGDWVTARLNGVAYLEKSPLIYWLIAISFSIFGVHDWAARIPIALCSVLLCWLTARFGAWAFGRKAGFWAGVALATCVGLFLFTRILIPDVVLTLTMTFALWAFLRALDEEEARPRAWALAMWASLGCGLLLKSLIGLVFPGAAAFLYLLITKQLLTARTWRRLAPVPGLAIMLLIAAPWHVLATLRNPPYLDLTMHSEQGSYRGFFWFYFINEQVLRFLNLRYPRDYNTVPRLYWWLFQLLWLFPWSVYFPGLFRLRYGGTDRASRVRLLALCWAGFLLVFFSLSTTQEYYSMPAYPALALLIGSAVAAGGRAISVGTRVAGTIAAAALVAIVAILIAVRNTPAPGDISAALTANPDAYTLSLGHMLDLTVPAFAYLRLPLVLAAVACLIGGAGALFLLGSRALLSLAVMMALFFHAARVALIVFDPYLGSRPLATAIVSSPPGKLIVDDQYYSFSSVFFYANRRALLLNGRKMNLEYGSYAPGAPDVFIGDADLQRMWPSTERYYLVANGTELPRLDKLLGVRELRVVRQSGGKYLFSNR
jgi:4-amino-4-deoxy-L-arabinose transferase-like glycosyltransferase